MTSAKTVILASGSASRQQMLRAAGVDFHTKPSGIDEDAVKTVFLAGNNADLTDLPALLAHTKAVSVSQDCPDDLVIGADQILVCGDEVFSKPTSTNVARDQLLRLRGQAHRLETAVCCAVAGSVVWTYQDSAVLAMRAFSNRFLGAYLAAAGDDVMTTVGGYRIEGPAIQLFEHIKGDYFTILGLPLLPLLAFLRQYGALAQ